jgi:hypothetical protein
MSILRTGITDGPSPTRRSSLEAPLALIRPAAVHPMPVEDYVQGRSLRTAGRTAGIDPETDLTVTAS